MYHPGVRAVVAIVLVSLLVPSGARAQGCALRGRPSLTALRVGPGDHGRVTIVALEGRVAAVVPLSRGLFRVTTADDGTAVEGTTREPIPLVVSGNFVLAGVATIASGTPLEDLLPRADSVRATLPIDDGVRLARVELPCAAIGLASEVASLPMLGTPAAGPRWIARVTPLRVRARPEDGAPRVTIEIDDRGRFPLVERERRAGWVRVEAMFARASVAGWVPDTDLAPEP